MDMILVSAVGARMLSVVCFVMILSVCHFLERSRMCGGDGWSDSVGGVAFSVCVIKCDQCLFMTGFS